MIDRVYTRTRIKSKKKFGIDNAEFQKYREGIFLQVENINTEYREIYTSTGEVFLNEGESYDGVVSKLTEIQTLLLKKR